MNDTSGTDLVLIDTASAYKVFTEPNEVDPILQKIRASIDAFSGDVTTPAGRRAIASMAHRVSRSKTYLDAEGKKLVDQYKEIPKKIDATRKRIRDTLDEWRDEVRQPLTEWEDKEKERQDQISARLAALRSVIDVVGNDPSDTIKGRIAEIERTAITVDEYGEHTTDAAELKDRALIALRDRLAAAIKSEAEQAELARLRAEKEAREQREREARIAKEAEEKAQQDAEAKANAERAAAERRELDLKLAAERAERRAIEAEANAQREAERKAAALAEEAAKRAADAAHRDCINAAACAAITEIGVGANTAMAIVDLIAEGNVPHVSINY